MLPSVRALLSGIIDYAGMFPPANLSLVEAVRNYIRYRQSAEGWMLGHFICPAARLEELAPFVEQLAEMGPPAVLSVLGRGGTDIADFVTGFKADAEAIAEFHQRYSRHRVVLQVELRLPPSILDDQGPPVLFGVVSTMANLIQRKVIRGGPFYEVAFGAEWQTALPRLRDYLCMVPKDVPPRHFPWPGYKLRCGGTTPSAIPSPQKVAFTIARCRDYLFPLKFTAGLHHPLRHLDSGMQEKMHGFLNVFAAGVLAHTRQLNEEQICEIVQDEDPSSFIFHDKGFRWKTLRISTTNIIKARRKVVTAFGSCSFEEPCDDLRAMGLLP